MWVSSYLSLVLSALLVCLQCRMMLSLLLITVTITLSMVLNIAVFAVVLFSCRISMSLAIFAFDLSVKLGALSGKVDWLL